MDFRHNFSPPFLTIIPPPSKTEFLYRDVCYGNAHNDDQ